ncbi:hypothetical protein SLEP1_g9572 [Rubroshorea leprosula]|uniref:Transcription factor VOZ1 n=1 Tax=Rubroshorea leprosula TaxID=152421 RepID=A0AAV5IGK4_9ROSI|nr:hypothetical protein SLEP1_g9572 [Rubroshorea leprosula]
MQNRSKSKCTSTSHQIMMDNAKNRLDDLQERFTHLQTARKEGRAIDVAMLEEQMYQSLREWKAELNVPSPASSLLEVSAGFSGDMDRLLQLCGEEDDATSALAGPAELKPETNVRTLDHCNVNVISEEYGAQEHGFQGFDPCNATAVALQEMVVNGAKEHGFQGFDPCNGIAVALQETVVNGVQEHSFQGFDPCNGTAVALQETVVGSSDLTSQFNYQQLNFNQEFNHGRLLGANGTELFGKGSGPNILPNISHPPSAFMGPKCALWDCTRPAQGFESYEDYCSCFHATLALNEDRPGMTPILRPGGISLKDNLLIEAVQAKTQGKNVGIPQCEGAATEKSPWNATELFDLCLLEGETIREWLFFDKPRRAFESGNRKQRSLPDYSGRGWHESRKQVLKEYGGQKRSYYMDPQPSGSFEWHLYEYEINGCNICALYRMELKLVDEKKKSPKGKVVKDPLVDLQKKMGRLTAEVPVDDRIFVKGRAKTNKKSASENVNSAGANMTSTTERYGLSVVKSSAEK